MNGGPCNLQRSKSVVSEDQAFGLAFIIHDSTAAIVANATHVPQVPWSLNNKINYKAKIFLTSKINLLEKMFYNMTKIEYVAKKSIFCLQ